MFTSRFLFTALAALLTTTTSSRAESRPNVIVILADDLGYSDLSCYGGEIPTPNLDRLATGGVRFSAFYTSARCCPSRASLLTGLHPHQAGIGSFAHARQPRGKGLAYTGRLHPTCATLAEILGDAGYSTWMSGKWHMSRPGPIERGFENYFGFKSLLAHSTSQWDPAQYARLPESTKPELTYDPGEQFFATDVFADYALEFIKQARAAKQSKDDAAKPFFLYLAHSAPHFPVQAPKESIDQHMETYRRGWDVLRAERFERQKKLGLVAQDAQLPPLSEVPVDDPRIANGYPGKSNPRWDDLDADRREDLARRMATFAAMVEHIDRGIGRILGDLEENRELENTLIFFLSDNGACYEWGPFGFDGPSRRGRTDLWRGENLMNFGQTGTHSSYGSGWANLGNTPLNMYKHFCHEGGIASPLLVHWPRGIQSNPGWIETPSHLMDIVPTVLEATGATYPGERNGIAITPCEGISLLPSIAGKATPERPLAFEHQGARGLRLGKWKLVWGKRQADAVDWEVFNLEDDRFEQENLASSRPEIRKRLVAAWESWAKRVGASPHLIPEPGYSPRADGNPGNTTKEKRDSPPVAKREIHITASVDANPEPHGVVLAQGGREQGYALHFIKGIPALDVRVNGKVTRLISNERPRGGIRLKATITAEELSLTVNGKTTKAKSPGLIPVQPKDPLDVGRDSQSAAGNYPDGNPFNGKVGSSKVTTRKEGAKRSEK